MPLLTLAALCVASGLRCTTPVRNVRNGVTTDTTRLKDLPGQVMLTRAGQSPLILRMAFTSVSNQNDKAANSLNGFTFGRPLGLKASLLCNAPDNPTLQARLNRATLRYGCTRNAQRYAMTVVYLLDSRK